MNELDRTPGQAVNVDAVVSKLGFVICEWGPEESDKCENCGELGKQLYFSGPTDTGTYFCLDCILAMDKENEEYGKALEYLEKAGHTGHCAARQVWGDGECECELKGIIPGPISRMMCGC